jgi:hypothetical protein
MHPQERQLNSTRYGEHYYGKWGDSLVSTLDNLVDSDICHTHPRCETYRTAASMQPGVIVVKAVSGQYALWEQGA